MSRLFGIIAGGSAVALGTWFLGWTMPVWWGMVFGLVRPSSRPARIAAAQGALGWAMILFLLTVAGDPVPLLATRLAGAMQIPAWSLLAATILYPALLASSSAWLTAQLRRVIERGPQDAGIPS
jgi:hypothetical protein